MPYYTRLLGYYKQETLCVIHLIRVGHTMQSPIAPK